MPTAVSSPSGTTAKQANSPWLRRRCAYSMNFSKPSTDVGGGVMNRATSSVVSSAKSDAASERRSSRSWKPAPCSTGSARRQSVLVNAGGPPAARAERSAARWAVRAQQS
jgi:hypothetical protein